MSFTFLTLNKIINHFLTNINLLLVPKKINISNVSKIIIHIFSEATPFFISASVAKGKIVISSSKFLSFNSSFHDFSQAFAIRGSILMVL